MRTKIIISLFLYWGLIGAQVHDLPLIMVSTQGGTLNLEERIPVMLTIAHHPGGNSQNSPGNIYQGNAGMRIRGQTSAHFDKKGYGLKLLTPQGADSNVAILGLPAEHDWVLHGPFVDKTLIRNAFSHELYRRTGRYSSRSRFVELYINNSYEGIYLLLERIKRDRERVAVTRINPQDTTGDALTGGYIFRIDKTDSVNAEGFLSARERLQYVFHYPSKEDLQPAQEAYLRQYINSFEDLMAGNNWNNASTGYTQRLDVAAAIDFILHQEFTKNVDAYLASFYMHKDRDSRGGRLQLGPPWDFNLAWGCVEYNQSMLVSGWKVREQSFQGAQYKIPTWLRRIFDDQSFQDQMRTRWGQLRSGPWHSTRVQGLVDSLAGVLASSASRNFTRWPVLGAPTCVNLGGNFSNFCFNGYSRPTWEEEIAYIRDWSLRRMAWIDEQFQFQEPAQITSLRGKNPATGEKPNQGLRFSGTGLELWRVNGENGTNIYDLRGKRLGRSKD